MNTAPQYPRLYETYIPILKLLSDKSEHRNGEIITKVRDKKGWGVWYLFHAGYLEKTKPGYYKIAEKGLQALTVGELKHDTVVSQKEYIEYKEERNKEQRKNNNLIAQEESSSSEALIFDEFIDKEALTPDDLIDKAVKEIKSRVKDELLERIKSVNPYEFETIILSLLKAMGYGDTIETKKSHDNGIDGIVNQDKLGLEKIYIQAKRFNDNKVVEKYIRDFIGAMSGDTNKGIFVTTSSFTEKAEEKAKSAHHKIKLIDGEELVELMYNYGIGVQVKGSIDIKAIDNDFFGNE